MTRVRINPIVLQWARRRAGLSLEQLARKVGLAQRVETMHMWEEGREQPTFRQARALARALHIPLGYLFLSAPPLITLPLTDFRTLPDVERGRFSPDLEDVLNDALRKRDWLRERRIQEGVDPLPFVGRFSPADPPERIAEDIRQTLSLPTPTARDAKTWTEHLRLLVRHAEAAGIIVLQSGIVLNNSRRRLSVAEFRGFALTDEYAPLIFINARDTVAARIFTLAHELGHLWTGTSGVSNPELSPTLSPETPAIEYLCNRISAELLVPAALLSREWRIGQDALEAAQELAKRFLVSVFVILIRGYELTLITQQEFQDAHAKAQSEVRDVLSKERERGGGNFYHNLRNRNSLVLLREVATALEEGALLYREAARLLNTQPQTLVNAIEHWR
ncbi:MAG: ImmA/IrrE family metallo-endopeptidase [Anaerolineae bacterium]|nr:ImmA/IrrE family metallo-endopeptidase [Anaerolineae bacterium]